MKSASSKDRREREQQARRQYILQAARGLVAEGGLEAARMEDIARVAGYTRRTLYAYFQSRDEILLTLYTVALAARWEVQKEAMASASTGLEKLLSWGRTFFAHSLEHPQDFRLQFYWDFRGVSRRGVGTPVFEAFRKVNESVASGLREAFELGRRDRSLRRDLDVDMCVSQYVYTLRAVLNRALSPAYSFARFEAGAYVEHYLELAARAVRDPGSAARGARTRRSRHPKRHGGVL